MTRPAGPPVEYLRQCSSTSLRYFEMSKLEHVANLRRELTVLLDEMMEESALALFARWMLEKRVEPGGATGSGGSAAKAGAARRVRRLLADFVASSARSHGAAMPDGGPPQQPPATENAQQEPVPGAGGDGGNGLGTDAGPAMADATAHVPPARKSCRSERRLERKAAARASGLCDKSPNASL